MKLKERLAEWLEAQRLARIKRDAKRIEREAEQRYNIVKHIQHDGSIDVYLTLDGERISTNYGIEWHAAVNELFQLRLSYMAEKGGTR